MKVAVLVSLLCAVATTASAKRRNINYDESKMVPYTLPDPLICNDGTKVTTVEQWEGQRRPELLKLFAEQVYGETPNGRLKVRYKVVAERRDALNGKATAQQVMFTFSRKGKKHRALALAYYPNNTRERVPVFIGYNFKGNHGTTNDEWVRYSPYFDGITDLGSKLLRRGTQVERWPLELIVERGYAVVTMCYHDIYPDIVPRKAQPRDKVRLSNLLPVTEDESSRWQAIGVWAYGLSRIADWVVKQPWADKDKLCVIGHSRQGKAALWAGAQDERFRVVISNNSGCGGAALSKRVIGENVEFITRQFPHWFCKNFTRYSMRERDLPLDQHFLLALVAPRHLYVASASMDRWADPKGEYLATYHSSPVFELYGMKGMTSKQMPKVGEDVQNDVGYHIREGKHAILEYDWRRYLDFCDKIFKHKERKK